MHTSLSNKVSDDIEYKIKEGILKEGEKLDGERVLAETYAVSRNVVREALKILKEKGLLEIVTGKGAYVTIPKADVLFDKFESAMDYSNVDMDELLDARLEVELVIGRKVIENITEAGIGQLEMLYNHMEDAKYDLSLFIELDAKFHLLLAELSGNHVLALIESTLNNLTDRKRYLGQKGVLIFERAQREHKQMLLAIKNRDYESFKTSIERHLECIRANL